MIESLDQRLAQYEELMYEHWFENISPVAKPRLTDFLTIGQAETVLKDQMSFPGLQFDEKFQILQAPTLLQPHIDYYRKGCELRESSLAVAYIDIDNFKTLFNSRHGETVIDRNVLPRFMAKLEAFAFGRGHAYRYGGDEYAVLLPGLAQAEAERALDRLRIQLSELDYPDVGGHTTVSIGLCIIQPECFLTNGEVEHSAEKAKNFAKDQGKNRIATFATNQFREADLFVCYPADREIQKR